MAATTLKCDVLKSIAMSDDEWALVDRCAEQTKTSRNDLVRRLVHAGIRTMLVSGLSPISVESMLREARGELLIPNSVREILTAR